MTRYKLFYKNPIHQGLQTLNMEHTRDDIIGVRDFGKGFSPDFLHADGTTSLMILPFKTITVPKIVAVVKDI